MPTSPNGSEGQTTPGAESGLSPKVVAAAQALLELDPQIIHAGRRLHFESMYQADVFVNAVLNRSLQVLHGFHLLVTSGQFLCAAPLLRLQIDNALRLHAGYLYGDFGAFTTRVMRHERIDKMRTPANEQLTDAFLVASLAELSGASWLSPAYERASGYVHLSGTHIFESIRANKQDRLIQMRIDRRERDIPEGRWLELVETFRDATGLVLWVVDIWIAQKDLWRAEDPAP